MDEKLLLLQANDQAATIFKVVPIDLTGLPLARRFESWQKLQFVEEMRRNFQTTQLRRSLWQTYVSLCWEQQVFNPPDLMAEPNVVRFNKQTYIWETALGKRD